MGPNWRAFYFSIFFCSSFMGFYLYEFLVLVAVYLHDYMVSLIYLQFLNQDSILKRPRGWSLVYSYQSGNFEKSFTKLKAI